MHSALIAITITLAAGSCVLAETLEVPSEYATIQAALDVAQPGDVIDVAEGTYYESDLVPGNTDITVRGAVNSEGLPAVVIDGSGAGIIFMCGVVGTEGVVLENIHFTGSTGNAVWIYHHSPIIRNCTFSGLATGADGAAIWSMESCALIEGCRFLDNPVGETGNVVLLKGGEVFSTCPTMRDCVFSGNSGSTAVMVQFNDATIEGCTFTKNAGASGGAISIFSGDGTIRQCTFTGNTSTIDGGALHIYGNSNPELIDCVFTNNEATGDGGGLQCSGYSIPNLTNCTFLNNTSIYNGGGGVACLDGGNAIFTGCMFIGNTAGKGGGIYCSESDPQISDSTISGNTGGSSGGGIYCYYNSSPVISNSTISKNSAYFGGGGIYSSGGGSVLSLTNCIIEGNVVDNYGGGLFCSYSNYPLVADCLIQNNSATLGGGVYCEHDSFPRLIDCEVTGNAASYSGGGIFLTTSDPTITGCLISGNTAGNNGGGMNSSYMSDPLLAYTTMCSNAPDNVFGTWVDNGGNTLSEECPEVCLGDLTGDGLVDGADLGMLLSLFGSKNPDGDLNGDDLINGADLGLLLSAFGPCS